MSYLYSRYRKNFVYNSNSCWDLAINDRQTKKLLFESYTPINIYKGLEILSWNYFNNFCK